jgi:hypothetical protein
VAHRWSRQPWLADRWWGPLETPIAQQPIVPGTRAGLANEVRDLVPLGLAPKRAHRMLTDGTGELLHLAKSGLGGLMYLEGSGWSAIPGGFWMVCCTWRGLGGLLCLKGSGWSAVPEGVWVVCCTWRGMGGLLYLEGYGWSAVPEGVWVVCCTWRGLGGLLYLKGYGWSAVPGGVWVVCCTWRGLGCLPFHLVSIGVMIITTVPFRRL